jgi:hypothetical protein
MSIVSHPQAPRPNSNEEKQGDGTRRERELEAGGWPPYMESWTCPIHLPDHGMETFVFVDGSDSG